MDTKPTAAERFTAKVNTNGPTSLIRGVEGPCHIWEGAPRRGPKGQFGEDYGKFWHEGRSVLAHRYAYEQAHGPIPEPIDDQAPRTVVDHRCRRRNCVNPAHLEAVDEQTNIRRGTSPAAAHARQTQCVNGHDLTDPANVRISYPPSAPRGKRRCRACDRARSRATRAQQASTTTERQAA